MPGLPSLREDGITSTTPNSYDTIHHLPGQPPPKKPKTVQQSSHLPENEQLWLPSAIPQHLREQACVSGLVKTETRMQLAVLDDALSHLCRQLRISSTIRTHSKSNGSGTSQRMGTRTHNVLQSFAEKIDRCAARYRAAYSALFALDPDGEWRKRLHELKPEDVRSLHRPRDEDKSKSKKRKDRPRDEDNSKSKKRKDRPSEGRRELSWIWLQNGPNGRPTMDSADSDRTGKGEHLSFAGIYHRLM